MHDDGEYKIISGMQSYCWYQVLHDRSANEACLIGAIRVYYGNLRFYLHQLILLRPESQLLRLVDLDLHGPGIELEHDVVAGLDAGFICCGLGQGRRGLEHVERRLLDGNDIVGDHDALVLDHRYVGNRHAVALGLDLEQEVDVDDLSLS